MYSFPTKPLALKVVLVLELSPSNTTYPLLEEMLTDKLGNNKLEDKF